jgi:arylsulfatase A
MRTIGRIFLATSAVLFALIPSVQAASRPNVILLMADDLGYECVSANGGSPYQTPVLDQLAASGLRFTNCVAQPLCTPSRVKIMTGRYNFRNYTTFGHFPREETTFAQVLKEAGYATCIVGKWQLGQDRKLVRQFGFDDYCLWWLERKGPRYGNVGELIQNDKVLPGGKGEYGPDVVCNFLLDFMARHRNKPFFAYYPMILTHSPFVPTPDSDRTTRKGPRYMIDMVAYTDKIVGRIVKQLDKLGIRDNTVLLFTGDNGTHRHITYGKVDGKPWPGGKSSLANETGVRVPLIANWPAGGVSGQVLDDPIDFSDFLPTLADLAGATLPKGVTIDGHSFAGRLRGDKEYKPREWAYVCYYGKARGKASHFVRDRRYKLYEGDRMFDFVADPLHQKPIDVASADQSVQKAHARLTAVLARMREQIASEDRRFKTKTILSIKGKK